MLLRERLPVALHGALEREDLVEHVPVERGDAVCGVDPGEDVVEIRGAEDHLERRGLRARVERDEPLGDHLLAPLEVALREPELALIDHLVVLHLRELDVCEVDPLVGLPEARVERLHLGEAAGSAARARFAEIGPTGGR